MRLALSVSVLAGASFEQLPVVEGRQAATVRGIQSFDRRKHSQLTNCAISFGYGATQLTEYRGGPGWLLPRGTSGPHQADFVHFAS